MEGDVSWLTLSWEPRVLLTDSDVWITNQSLWFQVYVQYVPAVLVFYNSRPVKKTHIWNNTALWSFFPVWKWNTWITLCFCISSGLENILSNIGRLCWTVVDLPLDTWLFCRYLQLRQNWIGVWKSAATLSNHKRAVLNKMITQERAAMQPPAVVETSVHPSQPLVFLFPLVLRSVVQPYILRSQLGPR